MDLSSAKLRILVVYFMYIPLNLTVVAQAGTGKNECTINSSLGPRTQQRIPHSIQSTVSSSSRVTLHSLPSCSDSRSALQSSKVPSDIPDRLMLDRPPNESVLRPSNITRAHIEINLARGLPRIKEWASARRQNARADTRPIVIWIKDSQRLIKPYLRSLQPSMLESKSTPDQAAGWLFLSIEKSMSSLLNCIHADIDGALSDMSHVREIELVILPVIENLVEKLEL